MFMSSKRFVFAVLFSLLIATVPLEHSEESLFVEVQEPLQTSGDLEDYELYLDRDRNDEGTELDFTTIEPAGSNLEDSILNNGIKFYTNELLSDLTIYGKSGNTARIFAFMQFETSDNATADITVKLFAGDSLIEQHTEVIDGPRCGGFFGDCAWAGYQIDLDLDNDGDTIPSGDKMRMEISATASLSLIHI